MSHIRPLTRRRPELDIDRSADLREPEPIGKRIGPAYYDQSGYFDDARHLADPASRFQRYRIENVLHLASPAAHERTVDMGCGWGTMSFALAGRVGEVVGVDFSRRSIEICEDRRRRLVAGGDLVAGRVSFVHADASDTGLDAGRYDLVVAADLLEHVYPEDTAGIFREAYRLLRPGGRLAIWTPHRRHFIEVLKNRDVILERPTAHVDYKSMRRIAAYLEQTGFLVAHAYYATSHLPGLKALERILQSTVPWLRRRIAMLGVKQGDEAARPDRRPRPRLYRRPAS